MAMMLEQLFIWELKLTLVVHYTVRIATMIIDIIYIAIDCRKLSIIKW